jgi:hypothetical protein
MTVNKNTSKRRKRKSKNLYGTGDKGKATRLHSKIIRMKGFCEICGADDPRRLQCAHIISRQYDATRVDLRNCLCLCARCHLRQSHFSPVDVSVAWIDKYSIELYNELVELANSKEAPDWEVQVNFLSDVLQRIESGEIIDFKDLY